MINQDSVKTVTEATFLDTFRSPATHSYTFDRIPYTILYLFTGRGEKILPSDALNSRRDYQKVILIFLDAFGWRFYQSARDRIPFLRQLEESGTVSMLTSQFPSTTAAHITTLKTMLPVGEHGIYEWNYYEPILDAVIKPLPFSYARDDSAETLADEGVNPEEIFPFQTFYQYLEDAGVKSYLFQHKEFAFSSYNKQLSHGLEYIHPFTTAPEAFVLLEQQLRQAADPREFFFLYYDKVDYLSHHYGPDSPQMTAEIDNFFFALERFYSDNLKDRDDVCMILTADHGQVEVDPDTTFYLNLRIDKITDYLKTTTQGKPIVPAGSPRDMFLHVKEDRLEELEDMLSDILSPRAEVVRTEMLVEAGFWGDALSPRFRERVGNLVILPYAGESVWWYEKDIFELNLVGYHGGLTPDEMEIPFILL